MIALHDSITGGDRVLGHPGALLIHAEKRNPSAGVLVTAHDVWEGPADPVALAADDLLNACETALPEIRCLFNQAGNMGNPSHDPGCVGNAVRLLQAAIERARTPAERLPSVRRLLAGHAVTREHLQMLVQAVQGGVPLRTMLPGNVLMWDGIRLAWWTPSRRRRIWFSEKERPALKHISRQEVTQPALLWVAEAGRLHLWALAEDVRPEAGTPIFQAPFLNTYADGWVCPGRMQWPKRLSSDTIGEWERQFHDSEGTTVWAAELTRFPGGHDALWSAMVDADRFPAESLVPTGLTVLDAINQERREFYPEAAPTEIIVPAAPALEEAS